MVWIVRLLLLAAGSIAALFVARDAPNFGVIQTFVAMAMILVFVGAVEWWMQRWKV